MRSGIYRELAVIPVPLCIAASTMLTVSREREFTNHGLSTKRIAGSLQRCNSVGAYRTLRAIFRDISCYF